MRFVKDHFDEYRESTIGGMLSTCNQLNDISYTYQAYNPLLAAFLAQTISLDDNTTVKFEMRIQQQACLFNGNGVFQIGTRLAKRDTRVWQQCITVTRIVL
jgi:hypothetical protein